MSAGFETYDDAHTLVSVRQQMRRGLIAFAAVSLAIATTALLLALWAGGVVWVPLAASLVLSASAVLVIRRLARLRRRVWRVAISSRHVVLLDAARRQRTVAWGAVDRVEVDDHGLTLVARGLGDEVVRLQVRQGFEPYVALAHRLVRLAERRRVAVWVDGQPWQRLDIDRLFPTLRRDLAGEPR